MLRGTAAGLEFIFDDGDFREVWDETSRRLAERPNFYRGSQATAVFHGPVPEEDGFAEFVSAVEGYGVKLRGVYGTEDLSPLAARLGLAYLGSPPHPAPTGVERKRVARSEGTSILSETARSLTADFAGARSDIAERRARGEASVDKPLAGAEPAAPSANGNGQRPAPPATFYHRGTLRGGQALQHLGTVVILGDVNPGAEVVATGDILVFGALRGTAHAGAQGDQSARVAAIALAPTQLRIAGFIASGEGKTASREAEIAFVTEQGIAIAPFAAVGIER